MVQHGESMKRSYLTGTMPLEVEATNFNIPLPIPLKYSHHRLFHDIYYNMPKTKV